MAETLRELVVSLSLQSDNFSKNIKSINAQIKEAESRFDAAGAGVDGFAKSTDGLKAKAGVLADKLRMQSQITQQYERALTAANATLQKNAQTQQQNTAKLATAKKAQTDLGEAVKRGEATYKRYAARFGETNARTVTAKNALDALKKKHAEASEEVKKLEGQLEANSKTMQRNADKITTIETALNKAKAAEAATRAELDKTNRAIETHRARWESAAKSLNQFGQSAKTAGQNMSRAGQLLTTSITAPLAALGGYAVKASIDAESAFAGVRKTVDMTDEEFARLDDTITQMSTTKPAAYSDIAALAETGGQLGIANENLEMFVSTMTDLGVATNLVGQEGAAQMAKFANVTGMSQENFGRMGAAIVDLGNNMATTEADIMSMAMRLGAAGSQVGLSESQILGFSAALSSVGIEAEAGGSAFSKAMIGMELAVQTGKNGLKDYAKVAGMSSKEFQKAWKDDAAGAMQAFIVGLSKMDEEGISTIKVLDDMGFSEVRLRDTLMRATNASGLFANAQNIASGAWKENTALTAEASKRYATTESRLTMLKNKSTALARTFGNDLSPAFGDIIDKAGEWIDGLAEMDAGQRQNILSTAAWLAAIGPGIMLVGKMNTGLGNMATGLGNLVSASVKAGGGLKGLFAATGSLLGPAGIAVLTGAAIYGAWKWYDYASGAKAAREATEAIMETAQRWRNTQAKTIFDTGNDPLARFGLSRESFTGGESELDDWLSRLTDTWSDGKKETREIVKGYVDEFVAGSDEIREAIKKRQETQEKYGVTGDESLESALKTLQGYDAEIEKLLKKRRNKTLSEDDQARLEQIIQERVELQLKYVTGEGGSYQSLAEAVEAEKARLAAEGKEPGADLYGDAIMGAAEGYQAQVDAINQSYHDQYAALKAITDEDERLGAIKALNAEHTRSLAAAQGEYNDLVAQFAPEAFESEEVQKAKEDMEALRQMISGGASPEVLTAFVETLDEGQLASYIALLKQMEEADLSDLSLSKDGESAVTVSDLLGGYDTIADYLKDHTGALGSVGELLGAASEEADRVLVDIALTPEGQTLKDWLDANTEFELVGTLTGLPESVTIDATAPVTLTNVPESLTVNATSPVTLTDVPDSLTVEADAPVTITGLPDGPLTIPANSPTTLTGLPESITVQCDAPVNLSDVPGSITVQADAPVTLTNVPEDIGIPSATIQSVRLADGVTVEAPEIPPIALRASITPTGLDTLALNAWAEENRTIDLAELVKAEVGVKFGPAWKGDIEKAWEDGKVRLYDGNGLPIDVDPSAPNPVGKKDLVVGLEEDGTVHVIVNPVASGDPVAIKYYLKEIQTGGGEGFLGFLAGPTASKMDQFIERYKDVDFSKALLGDWGRWEAGNDLGATFEETEIANMMAFVSEVTTAINNGEPVSQEALDELQAIKDFASTLETLGIGEDIIAGIGQGMTEAGWADPAQTTADNLQTAINTALGIKSPATTMIPTGVNIAAGVAKGINNGTILVKAAMIRMARVAVLAAKKELVIKSPSRVLRDEVGVMMARGIGEGVLSGGKDQERIIANAARQMADAAVGGASYDNSRTIYNQQNTVSLAGANLYVRDDQDIYALATEIATLTKRQQRGRGARTL